MPDNLQQLLGKLTAQKEALQDPSITDELLSRYWTKNPTERKLDELVLTVLGLASGYQGIKAAQEAPAAVEGAASSIPEVIQKLIGVRPGKGGETMMEHLPGEGTSFALPGGKTGQGISSHHTLPIGSPSPAWLTRGTESLTDPPLVEPLGRPTSPLKKIASRTPGGRFHGTDIPISEMKNPLDVPVRKGEMVGRGLYTTNNKVIGDQYARIKDQRWASAALAGRETTEPGSVRYYTHQIAPVRWLNIERPFPKRLLKVMKEDIINKEIEARKPGSQTPMYYGPIDLPQPHETIHNWAKRQELDVGKAVWNHIQEWAEKEGFGGLTHTGGKIMGDRLHKVKVYWHPEEQVRLRPGKYSLGEATTGKEYLDIGGYKQFEETGKINPAMPPKVSKPSIPAPKPKYVQDPLKTKLLKGD
jgi:hypothetical protein